MKQQAKIIKFTPKYTHLDHNATKFAKSEKEDKIDRTLFVMPPPSATARAKETAPVVEDSTEVLNAKQLRYKAKLAKYVANYDRKKAFEKKKLALHKTIPTAENKKRLTDGTLRINRHRDAMTAKMANPPTLGKADKKAMDESFIAKALEKMQIDAKATDKVLSNAKLKKAAQAKRREEHKVHMATKIADVRVKRAHEKSTREDFATVQRNLNNAAYQKAQTAREEKKKVKAALYASVKRTKQMKTMINYSLIDDQQNKYLQIRRLVSEDFNRSQALDMFTSICNKNATLRKLCKSFKLEKLNLYFGKEMISSCTFTADFGAIQIDTVK